MDFLVIMRLSELEVSVLSIQIVKSNVSSVGSWRNRTKGQCSKR